MKYSLSLIVAAGLSVAVSVPVWGQGRSEKRGLCFNNLSKADIELLEGSTSWMYNWSNRLNGDSELLRTSTIEYLPMIWSGPKDGTAMSEASVLEILDRNPEAKYLLGFNEPNLTDQADMTPQQAAISWPNIVSACRKRGVKIVSPAMNWGTKAGYSDAVKWFDEFFEIVGLESVDYIAYHAYMPNATAVMNDLARLKKYGRPLWLTEFCAASGSITNNVTTQVNFMVPMLIALEQDPDVFRYAWFKERGSNNWAAISVLERIGQTAAYTTLGKIYAAIPTFDPEYYHQVNDVFPATQFIDWSTGMGMDVVEGVSPDVALVNLGDTRNQYITYQVEIPEAGDYTLSLSAAGGTGCALDKVMLDDGTELIGKTAVATGGAGVWKDIDLSLTLPAGKHRLSLYPAYGRSFKLAALRLTRGSGIDDVIADGDGAGFRVVGGSIVADGDVKVYNLQGIEVGIRNLPAGVYIVVSSGRHTKIRL
ncbi:MAG: glycosyl hydrolase [Pseudoflavonifractor sp.]|nr:glycosyl hydrolase [Pseudoflavonifractor sp.]